MKILVTGAKGQLGYDIVNELTARGDTPISADLEEMDITDKNAVIDYITKQQPDTVIHCAAYTAVDAAEDNEELCMRVNESGTKNIASAACKLNIPIIYISTDYVFNGEGDKPWMPDNTCEPINIYGLSKRNGELAVMEANDKYFIVRISWVFGKNGKNFVDTMLSLASTRDSLSVVNDQIGSPTYTKDLSVLLADMINTDKYGIYHASNEGYCSWYDFAAEIFKLTDTTINLNPVSSSEFPTKAKRPSNSRLDKSKLEQQGFNPLPTWQDALKRYLKEV